jgi:hypothetical protein
MTVGNCSGNLSLAYHWINSASVRFAAAVSLAPGAIIAATAKAED